MFMTPKRTASFTLQLPGRIVPELALRAAQ
jgi:hypothetical protein